MQEDEIETITDEWAQAALAAGNWNLPAYDVQRELRSISSPAAWAITANAHSLSVLGLNDTLYTVRISDEKTVEEMLVRALAGEKIVVRREPRPAKPHRDTSVIRETAWTFAHVNGEELLSLTGAVTSDRISGHESQDHCQALAEALAGLAKRNAAAGAD
jgi:hypothetical protein